mmetsp:Transcript_50362/g.126160  ORF Transcript_50362/g.126160 Transcript_50362/m.126160 type:complete len:82 (-) Transcript_50362:295-540(-)
MPTKGNASRPLRHTTEREGRRLDTHIDGQTSSSEGEGHRATRRPHSHHRRVEAINQPLSHSVRQSVTPADRQTDKQSSDLC